MDSSTVSAAKAEGSESGVRVKVFVPMAARTPTAYIAPSVRIRASPSFDSDDDEIEFDSESDGVEEEVRVFDVNVNGRKESTGSSSFRVLSSLGSSSSSEVDVEEREEEGGFLSGEEDFLAALERPYVANEGQEEVDEDGDVAFVEPLESLRPIAKLSEDDEDDNAGAELSVCESDDEVALDAFEGMSKRSISNVDEVKSTVTKAVVEGLQELDGVNFTSISNVDEVKSTVTKIVGEDLREVGGVNFTSGGDSVVDSINVDVNVAEPGVVVVEDVKPPVLTSSDSAKPEENSIVTTKVDEREIDEDSDDKKVEMSEMVKSDEDLSGIISVLVPPSDDDLALADGVQFTSEGDAVVEAVQGDLLEPGVTIVNGSEEITNFLEIEHRDDMLVRSLTSEDRFNTESFSHDEMLLASGELVHEVEETNRSDVKRDEHVIVMANSVKFSTEGDALMEAIHINVSDPGVLVVEDSKEGEKPEVVLESGISEVVELAAVNVEGGFSYSDDDKNLEDGADQIGKQDRNEINITDRAYAASDTSVLGEEDSADDEIKSHLEEADGSEGSASDDEKDDINFASSEDAKHFLEELEQRSVSGSHSGAESSRDRSLVTDGQIVTDSDEEGSGKPLFESSHNHSQVTDGQIVTDSEEEVDSDEEGSGKPLFDSAALAALLKAAAGSGADSNAPLSPQDVSDFFSAKRPADLVSSLRARPSPRQVQPNLFSSSRINIMEESESNLSDEEKRRLEKNLHLGVKYLRLVYRLGQSPEDSIAAQVLHRLALLAGRLSSRVFSLDVAKRNAWELEIKGDDDLNFSVNILVIGKSGVGKSATINSIFGVNKTGTNAFEPATTSVKEITGVVNGVHIRVLDTPGIKTSVIEQGTNVKILASVKKATKKCPPDIVVYVDRLDSQARDLNDLPLLRTITSSLGPSVWRSAIVLLTHAASALPDGSSGAPWRYGDFVARQSRAVQQSIVLAVGDLRVINPSMMYPVSLAENHPSCTENGEKVLPNGQPWRPQFLMFCYSMKILSEASALHKQHDLFDPQKLLGFSMRAPRLPYLLSWLMQSRTHPKLSADQGGEGGDSDIDLIYLSDSEEEDEYDEYDQLPPFKPLQKSQLAKLNKEQVKAYHEEYQYRVKLLQKKQLKESLKRRKEMKKGKVPENEREYLGGDETDPNDGAPASVTVPLPDMVLPTSFDCDNPTYRYRFLESASQLIARPVLDNHGWDRDCGYDGVNLEQSLAIASRYPAAISIQLTKDKKEFNIHLDSSVSAKHGDSNASTMAGFDIQNIKNGLAYIIRGETRFKNLKKNKTTAGFSVTFLGENIATGVKIEDHLAITKRLVLTCGTGTVRCHRDAAYGANLEIKLRDSDFPICQDQSSLSLSLVKYREELSLGANLQSQFSVGHGSKVAARLGLNNKSGVQMSIRTSTSDPVQSTLAGILTVLLGVYGAVMHGEGDY